MSTSSKKSEDIIPDTLDKCIADGLIKTGSGIAVGAALSLVVFKRRIWPIHIGFGTGVGMAIANCQNSLGKISSSSTSKTSSLQLRTSSS